MRRVTHALLTVTAAVCCLAVPAPSASADGMGGADVDDSGIDYGIITTGGNSGGSTTGGDGGSGPTCTYRLMGGPENFPVYDTDGTLIEVQAGTLKGITSLYGSSVLAGRRIITAVSS